MGTRKYSKQVVRLGLIVGAILIALWQAPRKSLQSPIAGVTLSTVSGRSKHGTSSASPANLPPDFFMNALLAPVCFILSLLALAPAAAATLAETRAQAEKGDAKAQLELAKAYRDGKGVPFDNDAAIQWCRKAAEQGLAEAQSILGFVYAEPFACD